MPSQNHCNPSDRIADPILTHRVDHYVWTMYRDLLDQPVPDRFVDAIYRHAESDREPVLLDRMGELQSG